MKSRLAKALFSGPMFWQHPLGPQLSFIALGLVMIWQQRSYSKCLRERTGWCEVSHPFSRPIPRAIPGA